MVAFLAQALIDATATRRLLLAVLALSLATGGCAFTNLERELHELERSVVLSGAVFAHRGDPAAIHVLAYRNDGRQAVIADYQVLSRSGPYGFVVGPGRYEVFAFEDRNANASFDDGEPVGCVDGITAVAGERALIERLDIELAATSKCAARYPSDAPAANRLVNVSRPELASVATLDDPVFAPEYGEMALWEPHSFVEQIRGGVYFAEPYDPAKTPVLFVHGAGGTPRDWKYFVDHLDRSRYQPWFYYYASGVALDESAFWLNRIVTALHERNGFDRLIVVAHSMGGLVARRFILQNDDAGGQKYVRLFVSLSSPWGGMDSAALGVRYAPVAMPSWIDLAPGSGFLSDLYRNRLPPNVSFYLFYGAQGGAGVALPEDDGTLTVATQRDPRVSAEAIEVLGFDADHMAIINSRAVFDEFERVIAREAPLDDTKGAPRPSIHAGFRATSVARIGDQ